jgi:NADPH:quinone reductase-like Zn-dependent oxidoreductase
MTQPISVPVLTSQMGQKQMTRTVQFSEYGGTDGLKVVDTRPLTAGPGQVRLAMRAAGINPVDWKTMQGQMREVIPLTLPTGLGSDVAGVVSEVGAGVTAFQVGDEVLGSSLTPSFSEVVLADPANLITKPSDIPWEVAGSLAGAGGTAWAALKQLGIRAGETLLVHAAAGGVGTFAVQLAAARGVRVIGTASERNHEYLRSIGAGPIAYGDGLLERVLSIAPQGVDAVLDASGRGEIPISIKLAGGPDRVLTLVAFDAAATGIQIYVGGPGNDPRPALREIVSLIQQQRLRVPIRTFPLSQTAAALDASITGHLNGKIVVLP